MKGIKIGDRVKRSNRGGTARIVGSSLSRVTLRWPNGDVTEVPVADFERYYEPARKK